MKKGLKNNKIYLSTIFKVLAIFFILYSFVYVVTYSVYYIGLNDYRALGINRENYLLIIDVIIYFPYIIFTLFSIVYLIKKRDRLFVNKKGNKVKEIIMTLGIIYIALLLLDPFYHNFGTDRVPVFKLKSFRLDNLFLEILPAITIAPVFEEIFYRSVLLKPFLKKKLFLLGIIVTSLLYSASHFYITNNHFSLDILAFINYFFVGVIFSSLRIKYGLFYAISAHFFYNLLIFISKTIVNINLLDYIKSNFFYWFVYGIIILVIINFMYRLVSFIQVHRKKVITENLL